MKIIILGEIMLRLATPGYLRFLQAKELQATFWEGESDVVYYRAHSGIAEIEKGMIDWDKVFKGATWFHWTGVLFCSS